MSEQPNNPSASTPNGGRGRGKSRGRGGLGKYLRARGRGRGLGRPAEFGKRLLLEGEGGPTTGEDEVEDADEELLQIENKFSRRTLGSNADRYVEPEPELNSDGEVELEPEVDLSLFLQKQRISDITNPITPLDKDEDDEIDHTLAHISSNKAPPIPSRKGRVETIEWDRQLDEMSREKASAEAAWDLKTRFRAKSENMRGRSSKPEVARNRKQAKPYEDAPPLPPQDSAHLEVKDPMAEMEDFLDELLT